MNQNLEKLLKLLEIEDLKNYENGTLDKIIGNKEKTNYIFYITLNNYLPVLEYNNLLTKLINHYNDIKNISIKMNIKNENKEIYKEYFYYFIELYSKKYPLLMTIKDCEINIENEKSNIILSNISEQMKLNEIKEELQNKLSSAGFNYKINTIVDKEKSKQFDQKINEELNKTVNQAINSIPLNNKSTSVEQPKEKGKFDNYKRGPLKQEEDDNVIMGRIIKDEITKLENLIMEKNNITVEGLLYASPDVIETKTGLNIITLKFTDNTDSMYGKIFVYDKEEMKSIMKELKVGSWYLFKGNTKDDKYSGELSFMVREINKLKKDDTIKLEDTYEEKRVELHAHTKMSQMDGLVDTKTLLKTAKKLGHKACAITDHNGVQGFVDAFHFERDVNKGIEEKDKFKVIYGTELNMIDDTINIVTRPDKSLMIDNTYVVFDFETTGFNAGGKDTIIEIGAVKIKNGEIIETYDELINPGVKLSDKIVEVTSITDDMLVGKDNEENAVRRFIDWYKDYTLVAHNAKFDISFLEMAISKYNLKPLTNPVIDTLELSRALDTSYSRHSLSALVKRYNVPFDETAHHRADYDSEGTALVLHKMLKKLYDRNVETMDQLDELIDQKEIHKYGRMYHINILVKNKIGLKNLFKIISYASTDYLYKSPRILRSKLNELREGLLFGSGCYESEVFKEARSKSDEELTNIINFYDYIEVQPPECYDHLLQTGDFANNNELIENIKKIIRVTEDAGKIMVATGDVHHLTKEDKIYREIIVNQKVPGGGRHPLAKNSITSIPSMHFRTTDEMMDNFDFLDEEIRKKIVIENTNKIADMIEIIEVIIETYGVPFSPKIDNSVETVTDLVYTKARDMYGDNLPHNIEERIAKELYGDAILNQIKKDLENEEDLENKSFELLHDTIVKGFDEVKKVVKKGILEGTEEEKEKQTLKKLGGIIGGGFDVIYLIAQKLVKHSNDDGYLVGSRGSVGSSFVATLMGITEVNPLPAHYMCPKCKHSIFEIDGKELGKDYSSGFDLPNYNCPKCNTNMIKDGNDMPFATFLGFNADKVPDIDLNFSDLNQASAHDYTKVLFGEHNVYRAGTIGTVADKTAFGFVKGYCEDKGITKKTAEIERLAIGCTGVKRTSGQHPGGIVVVPGYMDVFDFTPYQFPADDINAAWKTTHFDYHAIDQDLLKLDILGHSDPTQLRMIGDLSGMDVSKVPLDDKKTMGIFLSPKPLGVTKEQIMCETGSLGIPEFGTPFTIAMLVDTKPKTFAELIKISGLSHGTDVWTGNAQELIRQNIVPFKDVIGCRDDIMVYLMYKGVEPIKAFKIMEFVRKGRASKDPNTWSEYEEIMKQNKIEPWFINSCQKIKYMFPKAHATAYVTSAFRIAYFKVHHPVYYYTSWLSTKATDFDVEVMIKGYEAIKSKINEIVAKGYEATNKENGVLECLKLALEATARGITFAPISLENSKATLFSIKDEKTIYPPFSSIDGLGITVAQNIENEIKKAPFLSIEDLQKRAKISSTLIDKMRLMGILDGMDESSQLSLF